MWSDYEQNYKEWCYNDCCNFKDVTRACKFGTDLVWTDEKCGYDDLTKRDRYKHFCQKSETLKFRDLKDTDYLRSFQNVSGDKLIIERDSGQEIILINRGCQSLDRQF